VEIPAHLAEQVRQGKAVLFLGAGASLGAKDPKGNSPPNGAKLAQILSRDFLGGKFANLPLATVAELAISESDLVTVQTRIKELLEPFEPTVAHALIPQFMWWGLATTNYDPLIEKAYSANRGRLQSPQSFIENGDRVEDRMRDPASVMLLKLHGCITRVENPNCPLILTPDQYVTHRGGRSRIFDHLRNWAVERTIVFVGHSLHDADLRAMLLEVAEETQSRPRYFSVVPDADDIELRFWETKKITVLRGTFEEFLVELDNAIPRGFRNIITAASSTEHPISQLFSKSGATLTQNAIQFLTTDVDYVASVSTTEVLDPVQFYRGHNRGWSAVEQSLDVRRTLGDTILSDHFLIEEAAHEDGAEFFVIKAHAGSGKSVLLRRIAWDAAREYESLCLYLRPNGVINTAAVQEIIETFERRVYLFVDDAADHARELYSLFKNIGADGKRLTVVAAERLNEWNVSCGALEASVSEDYELKYLTTTEISRLLDLLRKHRALFTLSDKTPEEQQTAFAERAGRQLLVALHEATLGRPFEDIIFDEYVHVIPLEAQRIYLSICVLNRLGVPVRAGIIARIHGVPFTEFSARFFKPLEHVVYTRTDAIVHDFMYEARHAVIAEIVFERVLRKQEERFDVYIRCLKALNIDYTADRTAFRHMIRGRVLLQLFTNTDLVRELYRVARSMVGDDPHLLHQMALYEMHRPNGSLLNASELLTEAALKAPYDNAIKHSRSEILLRMAQGARTALERQTMLREATQIATTLKRESSNDSFAYHTLVKIELSRLRDLVGSETSPEVEVENATQNIERNLSEGLQHFPGDTYLLTADAEFADLLADSDRAISSLEKAFERNPRAGGLATRLAAYYLRKEPRHSRASACRQPE
jgi:SIR2-like domain